MLRWGFSALLPHNMRPPNPTVREDLEPSNGREHQMATQQLNDTFISYREDVHILTRNNCFLQHKSLKPKGVLIHSTATPGAKRDTFIRTWDTPKPNGRSVCVHAFIDSTGITQTLPYDVRCWGCGSGTKGSANDDYLQVEMCEPSGIYFTSSWEYMVQSYKKEAVTSATLTTLLNTAKWSAKRLHELGIKEVTTYNLTSHFEQSQAGKASNHSDPQGLMGLVQFNMDKFRAVVQILLNSLWRTGGLSVSGELDTYFPQLGLTVPQSAPAQRSLPYKVKVTDPELNIRSGPGTRYSLIGSIRDKGVYTIVEESANGLWGQLKSGRGWICISSRYCKILD